MRIHRRIGEERHQRHWDILHFQDQPSFGILLKPPYGRDNEKRPPEAGRQTQIGDSPEAANPSSYRGPRSNVISRYVYKKYVCREGPGRTGSNNMATDTFECLM